MLAPFPHAESMLYDDTALPKVAAALLQIHDFQDWLA